MVVVSQCGSAVLTYDVDVVHVSCRDLLANLRYQVQGELDIVRLARLGVNIPHMEIWI